MVEKGKSNGKEKMASPQAQYGSLMAARNYEAAANVALSKSLGDEKQESAAINHISERLKRGGIDEVNPVYAFAQYHRLSDHTIKRPVMAAAEYRLVKGDIDVFDRISDVFKFDEGAKKTVIGNAFVSCLEKGRAERATLIKEKYPKEIPENERGMALDSFGLLLSAGKFKLAEAISEKYEFLYKDEFPLAKGAYQLCLQEKEYSRAEAIKVRYPKVAE